MAQIRWNQTCAAILTFLLLPSSGCILGLGAKAPTTSGGLTSPAPTSSPAGTTVTLTPSDATLSSGSLTLGSGNTVIELTQGSDGVVSQCASVPGGDLSLTMPLEELIVPNVNSNLTEIDMVYTPAFTHTVDSVTFNLTNEGSATGPLELSISSDSGGSPGSEIVQAFPVSVNSFSSSPTLAVESFEIESTQLTGGTPYHFTLWGTSYNGSTYTTGTNPSAAVGVQVSMMPTSDCANSTLGQISTFSRSGGTWGWEAITGYAAQIQIMAPTYSSSSPTAAYVAEASSSVTWDLSTFTADENSVSGASGSLTYDVGASASSTPTYSLTGLTKAQVLTSGTLSGTYFFLQVHFASGGFQNASLGNVTVNYQ